MRDTLLALAGLLPDDVIDFTIARLLEGAGLAALLLAPTRPGPGRDAATNELAALVATARASCEQEALYRALVRALPDIAVFLFDRDLRFLVADGDGLQAQGYRREDIEGRTLYDVLPPEAVATLEPRYRTILAGEDVDFTSKYGDRSYAMRGRAIRDERGTSVAGVLISQDVTARQRAQDALHASEARHRALLDALPAVVTVLDREGNYRFSGGRGLAAIGRTPEAVIGRSIFAVRSDRPDILDDVRRALAGEAVHVTRVVNGIDWDTRYVPLVDETGAPDGTLYAAVDVTARTRAERALQASESRSRTILGALREGVVLHDAQGRIIEANLAAERLLGQTADQLRGLTSLESRWHAVREDGTICPGDEHPAVIALRTGVAQRDIVMGVRVADSDLIWLLVTAEPIFDPGGVYPSGVVASFIDITARKRTEDALRASEARLAHLAMHDALTGLPNRRRLAEALGQALARLRRGGASVALLCLDLDGFKTVNDALGHEAGDMLLVTMADRLRDAIRDGDTPARLGGDELAVLLEGADADAAEVVAARLVATLAAPIAIGAATATVTTSIGVALAVATDTADDLLRRADAALYEAKRGGKNRYAFATA